MARQVGLWQKFQPLVLICWSLAESVPVLCYVFQGVKCKVPKGWNKELPGVMSGTVCVTDVLHEVPQQTAFLLGEQSPNNVIICCRESCLPVNM